MIKLEQVDKWYGKQQVLKNINLQVERSEVLAVCGPWGSGKSTLIRTVNRLEPIEKGRIIVDGREERHGAEHRQRKEQVHPFLFSRRINGTRRQSQVRELRLGTCASQFEHAAIRRQNQLLLGKVAQSVVRACDQ